MKVLCHRFQSEIGEQINIVQHYHGSIEREN